MRSASLARLRSSANVSGSRCVLLAGQSFPERMTAAIAFETPSLLWMSADRDRGTSERDYVIAAQKGSDAAFAELVRLHQRRAYAVARAIVLSHEDAEDAVQDAFLHAYRALDRFRSDQPFGAWLNRIVANAALDLVRRRKVRDADELPETVALPFRDPGEADELRRRLAEALTRLTDRQRAVIVLHAVEGYTHGEIGSMLGIPEGTARSDLHHARAALRRLLNDVRSDS